MEFSKDGYSIDAIQRAAYRFNDLFTVEIKQTHDTYGVELIPNPSVTDPAVDEWSHHFRTEVLDQTLRARIRQETEPVRNLILAVAFSNAQLDDDASAE